MGAPLSIIGVVYGRFTVLAEAGFHTTPNGTQFRLVKCRCECGNVKTVRANDLRSGRTVSCGCFHADVMATVQIDRHEVHGLAKDSGKHYLYVCWSHIKARCLNPDHPDYVNYGGRGIAMWIAWQKDPCAFYSYILKELGERPTGYSIDRKDNNRGYEPGNLRWATDDQQRRNRRPPSEWRKRKAVA